MLLPSFRDLVNGLLQPTPKHRRDWQPCHSGSALVEILETRVLLSAAPTYSLNEGTLYRHITGVTDAAPVADRVAWYAIAPNGTVYLQRNADLAGIVTAVDPGATVGRTVADRVASCAMAPDGTLYLRRNGDATGIVTAIDPGARIGRTVADRVASSDMTPDGTYVMLRNADLTGTLTSIDPKTHSSHTMATGVQSYVIASNGHVVELDNQHRVFEFKTPGSSVASRVDTNIAAIKVANNGDVVELSRSDYFYDFRSPGSSGIGVSTWCNWNAERAIYFTGVLPDHLSAGDSLQPGQAIQSADGRFTLSMHTDGYLALYAPWGEIWRTNTSGPSCAIRAEMQGDGNFVLYNGNHAVWDAGTVGHPGACLTLQNDGNLVVYGWVPGSPRDNGNGFSVPGPQNSRALWNSGTDWANQASPSTLVLGQSLQPGQSIHSADGRFTLKLQTDGNLVLSAPWGDLWATNTSGTAMHAEMQGDGNFVLYNGSKAVWNSGTVGHRGAQLTIQNDGNLVLYRPGNTALWSTDTWWAGQESRSPSVLLPGQSLQAGQSIHSEDGRFALKLETNGNLVLSAPFGVVLWVSNTSGRATAMHAEMQGDGNFVLYNGNYAVWNSGTVGHPGTQLTINDDGNLVLNFLGKTVVRSMNTYDWFSVNIHTKAIQDVARANDVNGVISHTGMVSIFRAVIQAGTVTAQEFSDLKTLVAHTNFFSGEDYVRVLSNKVVNGDPGNATYQSLDGGGKEVSVALGNLHAGSSSSQLSELVNMWFLGINEPAAATTYSSAQGSLYNRTTGVPSYTDVQQGSVLDCWLLASFAEAAARQPGLVTNMFTYDGTNVVNGQTVAVYTVRFFTKGVANYVTVDTELPSGGGWADHPANGVIMWASLAEKAYAVANGAGMVQTGFPNTNSYAALNGGWPSWALTAITGRSASDFAINPSNAASALQAGKLVVFSTVDHPSQSIVPNHAYAFVAYNPSLSNSFQFYNPWGTDSSGLALGTYNGHQVYGLFNANASFISQNFSGYSNNVGEAPSGIANSAFGHGQDTTAQLVGNSVAINGVALSNSFAGSSESKFIVAESVRTADATARIHIVEDAEQRAMVFNDAFFSSVASSEGRTEFKAAI